MKKLVFVFIAISWQMQGQIEPGLLFGLTKATSAEINSVSGMEEGQMLYNTDTKEILVFNGSNWLTSSNSNWLSTGNTANTGAFLGTTNDIGMDIRSNNVSVLQFGRRETLGLSQPYADYNDNNQYLTYIKGQNGISALQFQADAASFYKPMFFTNSNGNFRLKGSAAQTDFFEIGSKGTSNDGEMEFIIGDDGAEPFVFKRFDYRDQLLKELFRIQGSSDNQNARPRVGINTGQLANSTLQVNGSMATAIASVTSSITLDETHHTVIVNSNNTISLPAANTCEGRLYIIKNTNNSPITISSYLNNAGANATNIPSNSTVQLQSNGTSWNALSSQSTTIVSGDSNNSLSTGSDGGAYLKINLGGRWTNSNTSTDLNVNGTVAPIFGTQDYADDGTNLYQVSGNTLIVRESGRYDIRANLSLVGANIPGNTKQRTNVNARIAINGTAVGAIAASGYIRWGSGHDHSSIHLNEILQLNANDVVSIITYREANSGTVNFSGTDESSFMINKLR
jgi:hypothetical protein